MDKCGDHMQRILLICTCFGCLAAASDAGEIVLRSKTAVRGSIVRLSDLAEVKGSEGEQSELLAAMPLMPAPAAGSTRFLRVAELRDLLTARGVDLNGWRIGGADAVEFSASKAAAVAQTDEQEMPAAKLSGAEQLALLIKNYLQQKTGHELWSVTADADDEVFAIVEDGGAGVTVSGGKAPWAGRQRFFLSTGSAKPVAVYARVERVGLSRLGIAFAQRARLVIDQDRDDVVLLQLARPGAGRQLAENERPRLQRQRLLWLLLIRRLRSVQQQTAILRRNYSRQACGNQHDACDF
jgi:hypothetical protein